MPTTTQIERPPGAGRAWMIALVAMAAVVFAGLYLTREKPKPQYSADDLKQSPGAGSWADKERAPAPAPAARPQPTAPPHFARISPAQPVYRQPSRGCPACDERRRLLAQADASTMTVRVPGTNTLEIDPTPTPISTRPGPAHTVLANSWLYAVLETGIRSDQPGDVIARVSQDVRDTVTQTEVLIPVGSKLHGLVKNSATVNLNNTAVTVDWDSLQLPNGAEVSLPKLPSADTDGYPGLSDKVNRHIVQTWAPSVLVSAITAASMLSTTTTYGSVQGYSPTSQALGQFGNSLGSRSIGNLDSMLQQIRPSIDVRKGTIFRVLVTRDLSFDGAYQDER
jgi:type IV secretion system protein VirB10